MVPRQTHTFCVCVDDVVRLGVEPWRGCKFLFDEFFLHYQVEKAG